MQCAGLESACIFPYDGMIRIRFAGQSTILLTLSRIRPAPRRLLVMRLLHWNNRIIVDSRALVKAQFAASALISPGLLMQKRQRLGMEALAALAKLGLFMTVDRIAENRMILPGQMDPDLMGAPCFQAALHIGIA